MKTLLRRTFSQRLTLLLLITMMLSGLLSGCRLPWQSSKDGEILETTQPETTSLNVPTAEPRKDLPPALIEIDPLPNSEIGLQQPITLYFNQPMDTKSVEAAIHFSPSTSGRFDWEKDQILTFLPDQNLAPGTKLHLTLNTSAQAVNKQSLQNPFEVDFYTAQRLKVLQVVPASGTIDVDPESVVFVSFNQPVISLGSELTADPAFTLTPEVSGTGEWLNTSTYIFKPAITMNGGAEYTINLNPDLLAVSGAKLDEDQPTAFAFITTQPAVQELLPRQGTRLNLDGPVEITFNIRMDPQSVEEVFSMTSPDGTSVVGKFEWDDEYKTMAFKPDKLLSRSTTYRIQLAPGSTSIGGIPIADAINTERATYPAFTLDRTKTHEFKSYYAQFGSYTFHFTTPILAENFRNHINISPDINQQSIYLTNDNTTIDLSGYFKPEQQYTITLDDTLTDKWNTPLADPITLNFFTPPAEPSLTIATNPTAYNLVFMPASQAEILLQATNINSIHLEISPISVSDLMTLLHPDNYNYRQIYLPETLEKSIQNLDLERNVNEIVRLPISYQGNPLVPGIYFLGISSPELEDTNTSYAQKLFLVVSENNLVMKVTPDQAFLWATRLTDFSALEDTPVKIFSTFGDLLASGRTNADGLFSDTYEHPDDIYGSFFSLVGEPGEPDFGFTISTWNQSDSLYQMGIWLNLYPETLDAYLYTDRPIYRPGDTVHFRAAIFARENGIPTPPALSQVTAAAYSSGGMSGIPGTIYSEKITLTQFGTVSGTFEIPENAPTGMYRIDLTDEDNSIKSLYFDVASYRKPEMEVDLVLAAKDQTIEEAVMAEIQSDYYFGVPVADQSFSWKAYLEDNYFHLPGYQVGPLNMDWLNPNPYEFDPFGNLLASGKGITNADGNASLSFSVDNSDIRSLNPGESYKVNLEITITDQSGLPVSNRASSLIHPETFYIGVKPDSYSSRVDAPIHFSILTADWEKRPVENIPLEAIFESIEWQLEETYDSITPYRYVPKTTFIASASPITDQQGLVDVSFTPPEPGTYQLTLKSGNAITQVIVWVSGESSANWPRQTQNQIQLTPDTDNYQPGQIAQIFIPNPFPEEAKVLVSIERGQVMDTEIIEITGAGHMFSLPITVESIPNIYISVILLGKDALERPDFRQGTLHLPIEPLLKTLDVQLVVNPTQAKPRDNVSATLIIKDAHGKPVQGAFSVSVVDKSVLALMGANRLSILDALFRPQPLSVQTSLSLKTYAVQLALSGLDLGMGGGDGEAERVIREDFPDTAFWQAEVITGADGTAHLSFPLPDSLTTWVVDVRVLTEDYLVGQAEAEIITSKELMIRPITPRFLVEGDLVEMAAVVHNNTDEPLNVDVSLFADGFNLLDETQKIQTVFVGSGSQMRVTWMGKVESSESVSLSFQAVSDFLTDATAPIWGDLQVLHYEMPQTFSTAGLLAEEGQRLELVSLPLSTIPTSGELVIKLSPSLTATVLDSLEALKIEPYHDVVSILSRLLANLNVYLALSKLDIENPALSENLAYLVDEGIRLLLEAQNLDGGWSWMADSSDAASDPFITAYVLYGLEQAVEADLEVGDYFITRATEYLVYQLKDPADIGRNWQLDLLAFQVYALRNQNIGIQNYLDGLYLRRSDLSPWALSLLSLTMHETGGSREQIRTLLADIETSAIRSATGVHWENRTTSWLTPGTPIFNTSAVVFALAQLDPASTSLPLALQYLITHRNASGIWSSTFETAWSLMAIIKALQGTGDFQADYEFQASLNDLLIAKGEAHGTASPASISASTPINALHQDAPNALIIERGPGAGTLHYRADLLSFLPASDAKPINRGIQVQKDYFQAGVGCPGGENCTAIDSITLTTGLSQELVTVAITILTAQDLYHFMLEDFIPAGTEIVNPVLRTSQTLPEETVPPFDPRTPFAHGWGWWLFNDPQIYDDHMLWTAEFLPAGTYTIIYQILPTQRGTFQVLPAHAWQFFYPEVQGTSAGKIFIVE